MNDFKVQKRVKIPPKHSGKYPWRQMRVGDSFAFPLASIETMRPLATLTGKRLGFRFSVRKMDAKTARVWRVI